MLFSDLMHAINPHLANGLNVPEFMRDLIQRICDIPENEWYSDADLSDSSNNTDASLRKFYQRGISKKLARSMLGRLNEINFIDSINYESYSTRNGLSEALESFTDEPVDAENVGEVLYQLIKMSLEYAIDPELESTRRREQAQKRSAVAKKQFEVRLLDDCNNHCSTPGCGNPLITTADNGQAMRTYEIASIELGKKGFENLIALCQSCFNSYILKHTKKTD